MLDQAQWSLLEPMVRRLQEKQLVSFATNPKIIILSGIRRCGKSTLMHLARKEYLPSDYMINFDEDENGSEEISYNGKRYQINIIPCWEWLLS